MMTFLDATNPTFTEKINAFKCSILYQPHMSLTPCLEDLMKKIVIPQTLSTMFCINHFIVREVLQNQTSFTCLTLKNVFHTLGEF
jgi:hypothetical protein